MKTQIDTIIALKHGSISPSHTFFKTLPDEVILRAYAITHPTATPGTESKWKSMTLRLMLIQPGNRENAFNALTQALREYYGRE